MIRYLLLLLCFLPGFAAAMLTGGEYASPEERRAVEKVERANSFHDYDTAWELGEAAVAAYPDSLEALRALCVAAVNSRRITPFIERYRLDPGLPPAERLRALYVNAWTGILIGDIEAARQYSEEALKIADRPRFELRRVALVARRNGSNPDTAALGRDFRQFVDDYRQIPAAWTSYLNYFNFFGSGSAEHLEALTTALQIAPSPEAYSAKASLENNEFWGDQQEVLAIAEEGLALFPDNPSLGTNKLAALQKLGRTEEALAYAAEWSAKAPNHPDFLHAQFTILSDLNRWDDALAVSERLKNLRYAESYTQNLGILRAQIMHMAGRRADAIAELTTFLEAGAQGDNARFADMMRARLLAATEAQKLVVLPPPGYLQQRGNYCGPATMSVMLRAAGIDKTQEEIAKRVYTGIAGTPPQVLHHYAAGLGLRSFEFEGTPERWKALLDAGHPILWLQMLGSRGAHYRVVVGYDDVLRNWLVQDPNDHRRLRMSYDEVADFRPFPDMRRSFVMVPEAEANAPELANLEPTLRLILTNWVMYVSTGSNLFVGLFPAILVNTAVAATLAWIVLLLLRLQTFPRHGLKARYFFLAVLGLVVPVNLIIGVARWGSAVSLLLGLHLALITLIPLLALCAVLRPIFRDFFHPRESIGLTVLVALTWINLSFVDQDPWQWAIPVAVFALGIPVLLYPRVRLRFAERRLHAGDPSASLDVFRRYGSAATTPLFRALRQEVDALLHLGRLEEASEALRRLTGLSPVPAGALAQAQLEQRLLRILGRGGADSITAPSSVSGSLAVIDKALRTLEAGPAANPSEADLAALVTVAFRRGRLRGTALAEFTYLLTVAAALRAARSRGDAAAEAALQTRWLGPWRLRAELLRDVL